MLASPAWAQAPVPAPPVAVSPLVQLKLPAPEPYSPPLLGVQPPPVPPGGGVPLPQPPPPSQSHLPAKPVPPALTAGRLAFDLHPSLSFSEEYSDNFQLTATDKIDNFRSTLTPGLLVGINGPRTRGTVSATLGVAQDSTASFGDFGFFPALSAAVTHAFTPRLTLTLTDTFARSDEPALASPFGLRQTRDTFTSNTLGLSADWLLDLVATQAYYQLSTFFGTTDTVTNIAGANATLPLGQLMTIRAGYEFSHSTSSGATSNDSTGNLVWASLARQLTPLALVGVSSSYSIQTLESTRIWNVSLLGTYELAGRLSLSGSAGFGLLDSDAGGTFTAFTTNTSATYRFARAVIAVAILQDFNQTFLQGEDFGVTLTRSYTGTFGYALTPFIDANLRASYSQSENTGVGNSTSDPDDTTFTAGASLAWRLRPWLTMRLDYTYTRYNSSGSSSGAATENRAAIRVSASF